jgi:hypothetical protein
LKNSRNTVNEIESRVESLKKIYTPGQAAEIISRELDADYFIIDKSKLPETWTVFGGSGLGTQHLNVDRDYGSTKAFAVALEYLAIARKLERLEKQDADKEETLNKRRNAAYRRLFPGTNKTPEYSALLRSVQVTIDEVVRLEDELDKAKRCK